MNYIMVKEARELAGWNAESEALSVYQALEKLVDKPRAQGKRYSLPLLLTCILLAKMAGETTLQAITEWVRLHYRRDVTLAEDACQVRKGAAPHVLAVLNSFVLALFDFCGVTNAKQQMRRLDSQPLLAAQLLLKSLAEE